MADPLVTTWEDGELVLHPQDDGVIVVPESGVYVVAFDAATGLITTVEQVPPA